MGVSGEEGKVRQALRALEIISDTFLPVNEVVQAAVPGIMEAGGRVRARVLRRDLAAAGPTPDSILGNCSGSNSSPPQGGFYVTLRLARLAEDDAAERLLREEGLLVHPGHFYDIPPHHIVLSFVQEPP